MRKKTDHSSVEQRLSLTSGRGTKQVLWYSLCVFCWATGDSLWL